MHVAEAGRREGVHKLCFQQSTGDSTNPEIDVAEGAFWQDFPDHNIGDLGTPARFQDAGNFTDGPEFVGYEVQYAVRDHDIHTQIGDRQARCVAVPHFNMSQSALRCSR